jgi:hypothetical protein
MDWYTRSFAECAPWSYLLVALQCMLLAMLLERGLFFLAKAQIRTELFLEQLRKLVLAGSVDRALKLAGAAPEAPVARVCRAGLEAFGRGPFGLQEDLDRAIAAELLRIHHRLPKVILLALAVAAVGVAGSVALGVRGLALGGSGPLPLGLAMEYAPAIIGLVSGIAGTIGWLTLSAAASRLVAGLEQSKQTMLDLAAQHRPAP